MISRVSKNYEIFLSCICSFTSLQMFVESSPGFKLRVETMALPTKIFTTRFVEQGNEKQTFKKNVQKSIQKTFRVRL
jgi:hypothetical protein